MKCTSCRFLKIILMRGGKNWSSRPVCSSANPTPGPPRQRPPRPREPRWISRSNQTAPAAGFGNMLAKMMQDPDTRKFMREQQRLVLDQLYNPLVKQMGLTAEEGDRFKDLLAENTMRGTEKASSLFGGGQTGTNRTEALATIASEHKAGEDQIKELLGDDRYAQYKDYQQTAGERMQLNLFKQQLGGACSPHRPANRPAARVDAGGKTRDRGLRTASPWRRFPPRPARGNSRSRQNRRASGYPGRCQSTGFRTSPGGAHARAACALWQVPNQPVTDDADGDEHGPQAPRTFGHPGRSRAIGSLNRLPRRP